MRRYYFIVATAGLALSACNNNETTDAAAPQETVDVVVPESEGDGDGQDNGASAEDAATPYSRYTMAKQKNILDRQAAGRELSAEDKAFLEKYPPLE